MNTQPLSKVFFYISLILLSMLFSCNNDHDNEELYDSKFDSKFDFDAVYISMDSLMIEKKEISSLINPVKGNAINRISSEEYEFTIDTAHVLKITTIDYDSYQFQIVRNYEVEGFLENYIVTYYVDGSIVQHILAYPILVDGSYDVSNATVEVIYDDSLLYNRQSCASVMEFEDGVCADTACLSGRHFVKDGDECDYWGSVNMAQRTCEDGGWIENVVCTETGGGSTGGGTSSGGGSSGGGSNGNGDGTIPPGDTTPIVVFPVESMQYKILNCINALTLNGNNDTTINPEIVSFLNLPKGQWSNYNQILEDSSCSEAAQQDVINDLMSEYLNIVLELNPDLLLEIDCNQIQSWQTLAQHTAPQNVLDKIESLPSNWANNFEIQSLDEANGTKVNLDYFSVKITDLPNIPNSVPSEQFTANDFIDYIRLNFNDFVEGTHFEPYCEIQSMCQTETDLWNSDNPLKSIIYIDIPGDDGVVVCSEHTDSYWYFMTMNAPYSGNHPVSGTRQFGYEYDFSDGSYNFFVRGVDRFDSNTMENGSYIVDWLFGDDNPADPFVGSDQLWESFQTKLNDFVDAQGGSSEIVPSTKNRPNWEEVKDVLLGRKPLSDLGCN